MSRALKELRIHLCQTSPGSQGVREYIAKNYLKMKSENPLLPVLIREVGGIQARVFGRYGMGAEKKIILDGLSEDQVAGKIQELLSTSA
ncbi:hypothetical protein SeMB42_g06426 [Synchytrium endobioticum]|uniref:Ribosomal protein/NADH dehydrogenase domain-containing protein n=1 Tax=Synchytrium endobioticum TaxID=286115 RepID=A0A507CL13_9FUNG|nr:hypothetical protein SeMB42_g06426 [Synchytrium endobioticum]TPX40215.1 hypothetical protein SeLEV6574_g06733 [Synchytrium endobioticum]